jgi:formamidopyrimidine-DNA glycosylase
MEGAPHPLFHFGMTGGFRMRDDVPQKLRSSPKAIDRTWPPRFTKVHLFLDDGTELVLTDARRLGRAIVRADPRGEPPIAVLGFDPLAAMPSLAEFRRRLARRRGTLKGLMLDQTFAAGVGNWMADEVLYQAALAPQRNVESLGDGEIRRLRSRLAHVVGIAVEKDAVAEHYPRSWLFHHRWEKGTRTARGERIEHTTIAGRTTAWVPTRQR